MAQSKAKKSAATPKKAAAKKAPVKTAAAKAPARKTAAKTSTSSSRTVSAPAKKAPAKKAAAPTKKPVAKAKAAPRKAEPVVKAKPKTPAAASSKPSAPTKPVKRAVAASHRPQTAAVSVQARPASKPVVSEAKPAKEAKPGSRSKAAAGSAHRGPLNEELLRNASDADYMNDAQLQFFQERLLQMRNEVLARELDVKERLHQREVFADPADRASAEEEHWLDLRLRERESLLLKKIDESLRRIRDKEYGYCEKTGEPIGIARLLARPTATVCVDIKGQNERAESQYRDR